MLHPSAYSDNPLIREGIIFLATFAGLSIVLYAVFSPLESGLQALVASHAQNVLHSIGTPTQTLTTIQFWAGNKLIEISPLCAGLIEMILLTSVMIATRNTAWQKKLFGMVGGIIVLYAFNILRIVFTVQQIVHTPFSFAEFTHDLLFRLILFAGFAGMYYVWLNYFTITKN
jgi:exosortase/archaeosortase family protein